MINVSIVKALDQLEERFVILVYFDSKGWYATNISGFLVHRIRELPLFQQRRCSVTDDIESLAEDGVKAEEEEVRVAAIHEVELFGIIGLINSLITELEGQYSL